MSLACVLGVREKNTTFSFINLLRRAGLISVHRSMFSYSFRRQALTACCKRKGGGYPFWTGLAWRRKKEACKHWSVLQIRPQEGGGLSGCCRSRLPRGASAATEFDRRGRLIWRKVERGRFRQKSLKGRNAQGGNEAENLVEAELILGTGSSRGRDEAGEGARYRQMEPPVLRNDRPAKLEPRVRLL